MMVHKFACALFDCKDWATAAAVQSLEANAEEQCPCRTQI